MEDYPTRVIILNGPPRSGKDTLAKHLTTMFSHFHHKEFKSQLYKLLQVIYSLTDGQLQSIIKDEDNKENPNELLDGKSLRQALIYISESIIKPNYGKNYFGKSASKNLVLNEVNVFSDGGFIDEVLELTKVVDKEDITIVRIHRDGCDFSKDSRRYLDIDGIRTIDITNDDLDTFLLDSTNLIMSIQ